ncbi:MAG: hypothetical protein R3270_02615 [Gammaproteobacteria bacterium]|nr:hypothetical protein [Gammaproteobacteria bacterium]
MRHEFGFAPIGSVMHAGLALVLVVLPLGVLSPVLLFSSETMAAIVFGIALFFLVPVWALVAYTLLVQRLEFDAGRFHLRAGPWQLHIARDVLGDGDIEIFSPLDDRTSLQDRRVSGISIGSIMVGRFRHPDGRWAFKAMFGPGDAIRITDNKGTRVEFSPRDPQQFLRAWSATAQHCE